MPTNTSTKSVKKRPAPPRGNTQAKKQRLENMDETTSEKVTSKKRSKPVTLTVDYDKDTSSEDEGEDEEDDEGFEEEDVEQEQSSQAVKDPNASRESHKAQRALHEQRKAAKPHSALLSQAKHAWTLARQKNLSKGDRTKHIRALMDIVRGHVKDIVFKHDASRIIQTIVKYGSAKDREEVAKELKGKYQDLAQSKYSKFLITKLIRFCPTQRTAMIQEFQGHVRRLLLHREASRVLADTFELYANAYERSLLLRDFYGKEASLFSMTTGSEADKEHSKKGLKGLLSGAEKERRKRVMTAVKDNLVNIFNNPDKGAVSHAIVHRVLWEYLCAVNDIDDETEREKHRREMFENCQDVLAEMVHTKDGSRAVREFIAQGTAKDRKHIVKAMKPHIERMCQDDDAQLVLFTALDVIDDTKLTSKSLVADVAASASSLYTSPQGRRALIYLVQPRTRRHFTPAQIALLGETDEIRSKTSKKDNQVRSDEIRKAASEPLLAWIADQGPDIVRDPGGSLVVGEIMLYAEGGQFQPTLFLKTLGTAYLQHVTDKKAATESILKALAQPYPASEPSSPHLISLSHASRLYKLLLQGGHYSKQARTIERSVSFDPLEFARSFMDVVGKEIITSMALEEGAFVVAALCETLISSGEGATDLRTQLSGWFDQDTRKRLQGDDGDHKGRSLLIEQIVALG